MKILEAIGNVACNEKRERGVAIMEEDGLTAVLRDEQGGADAVGMDHIRREIRDCLPEKRFEATAVLQILQKASDVGWPMPRRERLIWKRLQGGSFRETAGRMVGGHEQWTADVLRQMGRQRPEAFLRAACEGGAVEKKDVQQVVHVCHVDVDGCC